MHRGCTSILRNGILKQYPPVLLRLGASNVFGNNAIGNKHLWENNCDSHKHDDITSSLNIQNEEELRKACIQMIEQCQLMVRKLQLQECKPNSKSSRRRRNPRNSNSNTVQNMCCNIQPLCCPALVATQPKLPPPKTATTAETKDTICCCCCCTSAPNKHDQMKEDKENCSDNNSVIAAPSVGPKLLQTCTVKPPTTKTLFKLQLKNRRGTTRNRVTRTSANSKHARRSECQTNEKHDANCEDINRHLSIVKSSVPLQQSKLHSDVPPLQLSVTPLQNRLRAEARATVDRCANKPFVHSKTERVVDVICKSTMMMMEQLGRIPRILQTPLPMQFQQPTTVNRSAKNSLPNLPLSQSMKKCSKKKHTRSKTETFLHSPCKTPPYEPPKILKDCAASKRLYSRTNVDQSRTVMKIVTQTPISAIRRMSSCRTVRLNQQMRQIMTSICSKQANDSSSGNEKNPPTSDDSDVKATCTGNVEKNNLRPKCQANTDRQVCTPEMPVKPCAIEKVVGPCKNQLILSMAAITKSTSVKHHKKGDEQNEKEESFKTPGHCLHHPPNQAKGTVTNPCKDNVCSRTDQHPMLRLRRPPVPKHLLKRHTRCFEPCMSKDLHPRRTLDNCERKKLEREKLKHYDPIDPMKRPLDPCASINRCKQPECPALYRFAPPPKTNEDLPPPVMPFPKDLCGKPNPDVVPPWELKGQRGASKVCCPSDKEVNCKQRRSVVLSGKKNTCEPYKPKPKRQPPFCPYNDDESFTCPTDGYSQHPAYPDPICPPLVPSGVHPQRVKDIDVLRQVPCAKRYLTCHERRDVDDYCDPCYKAKELHEYSGTAYYDIHNYLAGRRRIIPGPKNYKRKGPWKEEPC